MSVYPSLCVSMLVSYHTCGVHVCLCPHPCMFVYECFHVCVYVHVFVCTYVYAHAQGRQNKCESGDAQRMDIELHWQLPKAA